MKKPAATIGRIEEHPDSGMWTVGIDLNDTVSPHMDAIQVIGVNIDEAVTRAVIARDAFNTRGVK